MRVRKRSILFALAVYTATGFLGLLASVTAAPAAQAAPSVTFAFDYNPDPQTVTAMVNATKNNNGDNAFQSSEVYAQGGLFGSGAEFTYQRFADGDITGVNNGYEYSYDYTCANGTPQTTTAATNVDSYTVEVSVLLTLGPSNGVTFNNLANISKSEYKLTHVTFNGAQNPNQPIVSHSDAHNASGIPQNDGNLHNMGFPSSCVAYPFSYGDRNSAATNGPMPNLENNAAANASWQPVIAAAQAAGPGGTGPPGSGTGATQPQDVCAAKAGTFGWLICPAIDLANTTINTLVQQIIIPELQINPLSTSSGDSQYKVWNNMRTLADVLFVIIFLVIIFANTLQFNMNAYTIKKVIPRLVAAAILVQFSFILSSVMVDIGNVLGGGIKSLVSVVIQAHPSGPGSSDPTLYGLGAAFDTAILIGAVAVIGVPTILVAGLAGLISVLGVVFTLVARQLIITVLVVVSPLAFAAFVLPNTDRYFSMWLKTFIRISLMFPMIILLLSAAAIGENTVQGGGLERLLAVIFPIIAFFMIPMTFKWAGSAMNMAAGGVNKLTNKANSSGAMKGLRTGARERQQRINQDRAAGLANATVFGRNIPGSRRVMTGLGRIGTGKVLPGSRTQSDIALASQKAMAEESKRVEALNLNRGVLQALATGDASSLRGADLEAYDKHKSISKTLTGKAAVANQMAKKGDVTGLEAFRQHLADQHANHGLDEGQATQLWNGAKSGAFKEIKSNDPIMAVSGWQTGEYDGTTPSSTTPGVSKLQESMGRLSGEDIAGMMPDRLTHYAASGAMITAGQLGSATSDKTREGKSTAHQDALLELTQNGAAAHDLGIQREHLIRFDYSSGAAVARSDAQVREIKRRMALDPPDPANPGASYSERVDETVGHIVNGTAPVGGPSPTSIPLT